MIMQKPIFEHAFVNVQIRDSAALTIVDFCQISFLQECG